MRSRKVVDSLNIKGEHERMYNSKAWIYSRGLSGRISSKTGSCLSARRKPLPSLRNSIFVSLSMLQNFMFHCNDDVQSMFGKQMAGRTIRAFAQENPAQEVHIFS